MKKSAWWMSAVLALILGALPALTERTAAGQEDEPKKRRKKARPKKERPAREKGPRGEYAIMAKVLEMDEAQKAKLMEVVENSSKAMKAWNEGPNGQKYKELSEAAKQARKDKDKEKMKSISQEMKALQKERTELTNAQRAAVMAILTDEQKAKWAGFVLYRSVARRYKKANLTEDQDKQVRDICAAAAKGMPDTSDRKARGAALRKLYADIDEKVLTDAQREEIKKKPAREPRPKKEPRAKRGKKEGAGGGAVIVD